MRRLFPWLALTLVIVALAQGARADTRADARRYFQQGMALIEEGKFAQGIELLKKAYTLKPHHNVLFNIGRAYAGAGQVDSAIEYFERYLDADPPDARDVETTLNDLRERKRLRLLVDEGMTAIDEGRYAEGISLLRRAYDARPHPNILYNIARAYEDAQDAKRAIAAYEKYLESNPRDVEDVKNRLKRLKASLAKRPPEPVARREPPPPPARKPPTKEGPPAEEPKPAPAEQARPELSEEQLERLAQMIAQVVKREAPPPAEPPVEARLELPPVSSGPPREVRSSSVAVGEAVQLQAKSGEVFEEKVVTASRREQSPLDAPNAVTVLTEEDIRLSGVRSLPDLLRRVPGMDVMAMSYSDFNVAMRGFNRRVANKILVLVDGRTVYEDFLGGMLWRGLTIDLSDIARIEVVRGPGSAIYGAYAYTGMVNIITKRPDELGGSTISAAAGNGRSVEAAYQYGERRGPVGMRVSVGFERGDKYALEFDPERVDYVTEADDPMLSLQQARFDLATEYNIKSAEARVFLGGGARVGIQELYGVAALRNQLVDGRGYNVRGGFESELFSLLAFWNGLRADSTPQFYRQGTMSLGSSLTADIVSVEPIFRPTLSLFGEHAFVLGGEYRHKFIRWDYLDGPHEEDHFAAFLQDSWKLSEAFGAIVSARLDLHPIIGPLASPRVAFIFKPTPRQALRASLGTAFRQPTQAETYLKLAVQSASPGVSATLVGGQDGLDPENIATLDVGYLLQPDFGELEAVAYVNRVGKLITRTPLVFAAPGTAFSPEVGAFPVAASNYINDPRHFLALGTELSARLYPIEGVDVGGSYAFQYIFDEDSGERFTDSPLHKLTLWGQLRTSFGMDVGLSAHFVSDQQWIEPDYDPNAPGGFDREPLPVPSSVVLLGRIGYRMLEDKLEVAVSGTNLADFGSQRHREHPYANRVEARVFGSVSARF